MGSKDGLLDLVLDEIIGEHQVPDPEPARWQEQIKEVARHQRRVSLRHPYVVRISIGRIPMGPKALQYSERVLAILRAAGLPPRLAVQGYLLLCSSRSSKAWSAGPRRCATGASLTRRPPRPAQCAAAAPG